MNTANGIAENFIRPGEFLRAAGVRAGQTFVHFGSGSGFYLLPAAKIVGKDGKAIGIDVLTHLLSDVEGKAQREGLVGTVQTVRANLEMAKGSTLPSGSADWVLVANILHLSDVSKIMAEARRVIKDDGAVLVIEWDTGATPLGPPPDDRVAEVETIRVAQEQGLKKVQTLEPSPYHYGLVLKPEIKGL